MKSIFVYNVRPEWCLFSLYPESDLIKVVIICVLKSKRARLLLNEEERKKLAWYMYILIYWVNAFLVFLLALAPTAGLFYIALVWQLIVSAILFTRLILQS